MEWIKCSDRLPKEKEEVIFWCKFANTVWFRMIGYMKKKQGDVLLIIPAPDHFGKREDVTMWHDLPEPPTSKTGEQT